MEVQEFKQIKQDIEVLQTAVLALQKSMITVQQAIVQLANKDEILRDDTNSI